MTMLQPDPYRGRFAPSPTGELHFGSLIAALASFLDARSANGQWFLRIEDLDPPREISGSTNSIISSLECLGLNADGHVLYQSQRHAAYREACDYLMTRNLAYWCGCSRSELPASGIYPGTCRNGIAPGKTTRALRLKTGSESVCFDDGVQGTIKTNLESQSGDFVIRRADGYYAYQLAVVVDDAFQGINRVIRGADLLDSTARQIYLQQCLQLPTPQYAHIAVATDDKGQKLSKRFKSDPLGAANPLQSLRKALVFLGHPAPELELPDTLAWAISQWELGKVPKLKSVKMSEIK